NLSPDEETLLESSSASESSEGSETAKTSETTEPILDQYILIDISVYTSPKK
ncbi:13068_t:CDS:1, partial [Acaulospora morrowiae]